VLPFQTAGKRAEIGNPRATVIHVDNDALWRDAVAAIVDDIGNADYLGCATSLSEAVSLVGSRFPDVVVLDVCLPDGNGLNLLDMFAKLEKRPRVILVTAAVNDAVLFQLMRGSIMGLASKNKFSRSTLQKAAIEVISGRRYTPSDVSMALEVFRQSPNAFFKILSDREISLLPRLGVGDSDYEIAVKLGVSPLTIRSHRHHILHKLRLENSGKLMRWVQETGFVQPFRVSRCFGKSATAPCG
jgi:DNA-binding NarL/FixJ family response regulator